jgi:hypothetical protein
VLALAALASGCVRVYHPMTGLHDPIVVNPRAANLRDVDLTVHCIPDDMVRTNGANALCRYLSTLFTNQGAVVRTITSPGRYQNDDFGAEASEPPEIAGLSEDDAATDRIPLFLEIRSRQVRKVDNMVSWIFCVQTLTLVPSVQELVFAQDITVRDGSGVLLVRDTLMGRMVRYFGAGAWAGNWVLNAVWRKPEDDLTQRSMRQDLSDDMYRQLSQHVFNARMHAMVLAESAPPAPAAPEDGGTE